MDDVTETVVAQGTIGDLGGDETPNGNGTVTKDIENSKDDTPKGVVESAPTVRGACGRLPQPALIRHANVAAQPAYAASQA
jgi:hypothetical protein